MIKVKLPFSKLLVLLLVVCLTFFAVQVPNAQKAVLAEDQSQIAVKETSKYQLASEVLSAIGIAQRYDMHFDHLMGSLIGKGDDFELYARFRKMFIREIGWKHFEDAYVVRLTADFSEDELKELLKLANQPLMKKIFQSEVKAYGDTSRQRFGMGFVLWDNYNKGQIDLPAN